jgi:hypothetical protein
LRFDCDLNILYCAVVLAAPRHCLFALVGRQVQPWRPTCIGWCGCFCDCALDRTFATYSAMLFLLSLLLCCCMHAPACLTDACLLQQLSPYTCVFARSACNQCVLCVWLARRRAAQLYANTPHTATAPVPQLAPAADPGWNAPGWGNEPEEPDDPMQPGTPRLLGG